MSTANHLQPLAWDSQYLGFGVARLRTHHLAPAELAALLVAARSAGLRLLYLIAAPTDTRSNASARAAGAWLADCKVTFTLSVDPAEDRRVISPAIHPTTTCTPELETLALQSGEHSRFRLDPRFAPGVFTGLYQQWLRNALAHQLAREVLVYSVDSAVPQGLLTLGVKDGRADIGLLSVVAARRGQQIGRQLVEAARQRTAAWQLAGLQVVTQLANGPACVFYRRCGFSELQVEHIYHLWL